MWTSEFIAKESHEEGSLWRGRGFVSFVQYQFAQRWWLQSRGEYLKLNSSDPADPTHEVKQKQSVLVAFLPSEFSGFRLQYDHLRDDQLKDEHKLSLQMSFSIGAHPAHLY